MTEVIGSNFGQPEGPAQQLAALERLKYVMSLLPDLSISLNPPDIMDPHVINIKQKEMATLWMRLRWQIDMINAELALCTAAQIPVPSAIQDQVFALVTDISNLQKDLQCVYPSSPPLA